MKDVLQELKDLDLIAETLQNETDIDLRKAEIANIRSFYCGLPDGEIEVDQEELEGIRDEAWKRLFALSKDPTDCGNHNK